MKLKNKFFENKKLQFIAVFAIIAILIFGGTKTNSIELSSEVLSTPNTLSKIEVEVNKVKYARENYFTAIGKNNGGAYDKYLESANCVNNLDLRLITLKDLRNNLQRLSGEIIMRERENASLMPKASIEIELDIIREETEASRLINQLGAIETELRKIKNAVADDEGRFSKEILVNITAIKENLASEPTVTVIAEELNNIEEKTPYLTLTDREIVKTSIANIRKIIGLSEEISVIRQLARSISSLTEDEVNLAAIEADLQEIEARIPNLPKSQQVVVQDSVDTIRELISRKKSATTREEEVAQLETDIQGIADTVFSDEELSKLQSEELEKRTLFQADTAALENCMQTYNDIDKCQSQIISWTIKKESYREFIVNLEDEVAKRTIRAEAQIAPLQERLQELQIEEEEDNFSPKLSALTDGIEAQYLKAGLLWDSDAENAAEDYQDISNELATLNSESARLETEKQELASQKQALLDTTVGNDDLTETEYQIALAKIEAFNLKIADKDAEITEKQGEIDEKEIEIGEASASLETARADTLAELEDCDGDEDCIADVEADIAAIEGAEGYSGEVETGAGFFSDPLGTVTGGVGSILSGDTSSTVGLIGGIGLAAATGDISGAANLIGQAAGSIVSAPLEIAGALIGGATETLGAGIAATAEALGISSGQAGGLSSSGTVFDGLGAINGLQTFKQNYKGNTYDSAVGSITGWTNFTLPFVGVLAIAALVYAGFLYITAAGNEEQTKKAKNIIIWVVIGIVIIFSAYAIVNTLLSSNSSSGGGGTSVGVNIGGISVGYDNN